MGKGTIISGGEDGQYTVRLDWSRDHLDAEVVRLTTRISGYTAYIATLDAGKVKDRAELEKSSLERRLERVQAWRAEYTADERPVWCADLTEDLSGEVGTIEVPGEPDDVYIQPGYDGNAVYDSARDGQLEKPEASTRAAVYWNWALMPLWQKYMPTHRTGTITAISGDTADVTLDAAVSSQQSLNINQADTLSGVPIDYMTCDGDAFEVGDGVVIEFVNQDWGDPVIIGFKSNPKPCDLYFRLSLNGFGCTKAHTFRFYGSDYEVLDTVAGDTAGVVMVSGEAVADLRSGDFYVGVEDEDASLFNYYTTCAEADEGAQFVGLKYVEDLCTDYPVDLNNRVLSIEFFEDPDHSSTTFVKRVHYKLSDLQNLSTLVETTFFDAEGIERSGYEIDIDELYQIRATKLSVPIAATTDMITDPEDQPGGDADLTEDSVSILEGLVSGDIPSGATCYDSTAIDNVSRDCPAGSGAGPCEGQYLGYYGRCVQGANVVTDFVPLTDEYGKSLVWADQQVDVKDHWWYQVPAYYYDPDPTSVGEFTGNWYSMADAAAYTDARIRWLYEKIETPSDRF